MSDVTGTDTLTFLNDVVDLDVFDKGTIGHQITGTWVGTITWTASIDGTNFFAILPMNSAAATATANATVWFNVVGIARLKLTMTAYTSGTAVVNYVGNAEALVTGTPTLGGSPGTTAGSLGKAEDSPHSTGDTGVFMLGVRNDTAGSLSSANFDYSVIGTTTEGFLFAVPSLPTLQTALGLTVHRFISAATTNAVSMKGASGSIGSIVLTNSSAAIKYMKFYNKASAPTVGTDTPTLVIGVPATSTVSIPYSVPMTFSVGIAYATTALATDADATAVAANDLLMTVVYR